MEFVECKHCKEYDIERALELNEKEVRILLDLMGSEWVQFLEKEEEILLEKMKGFLKGEEE